MRIVMIFLLVGCFAKADEVADVQDELCTTLAAHVHASRVLKKQNQIKAMTGTFNKVEVYEAGKTIANAEPKIEILEEKYEALAGDRIGFGECPQKYRAGL